MVSGALPRRPAFALPFTFLASADQVRLVAGEDFRYTLAGPGLGDWLPDWLRLLDGSLTFEDALQRLPDERRPVARQVALQLVGERVLVDGPVERALSPFRPRLVVEGNGALVPALAALVDAPGAGGELAVLCQDRLDLGAALTFNERCLGAGTAWLWLSCAAGSRGYVSPLFLPDAGPCLECLLGHFRRRSPLPELYDELIAHGARGGAFAAMEVPAPAIAILAHLARWKADLLAERDTPAVLFRLHVLEMATLEVSAHPVLLDPLCRSCRGRR